MLRRWPALQTLKISRELAVMIQLPRITRVIGAVLSPKQHGDESLFQLGGIGDGCRTRKGLGLEG